MNNDISYEDIIEKDILDLLGANNMPEEQKRNLYTKMMDTVMNRAMIRVHDALSEKDREEWKKLLDEGDKPKMDKFLHDHGVDLPKILVEEALILKTELVDLAKKE